MDVSFIYGGFYKKVHNGIIYLLSEFVTCKKDCDKCLSCLSMTFPKNSLSTQFGNAAPNIDPKDYISTYSRKYYKYTDKRAYYKDKNNRKYSVCAPVRSFRAGYVWDRFRKRIVYGNFQVKYNKQWREILPIIEQVWLNSINYIDKYKIKLHNMLCPKSVYILKNLPFTTATINQTLQTWYHIDKNNVEGTLSMIFVLKKEDMMGCSLLFPTIGFGIDMEHGSVTIGEFGKIIHGNSDILLQNNGEFSRISVVLYVNKMVCNNHLGDFHDNTK
jgi:hypothetical protein